MFLSAPHFYRNNSLQPVRPGKPELFCKVSDLVVNFPVQSEQDDKVEDSTDCNRNKNKEDVGERDKLHVDEDNCRHQEGTKEDVACGAEIAADRKMLPEVIPEKDSVEGDADKRRNRGPFNTDDWDEQHIEGNVEEGGRTACIEGLAGMVNGTEGCTKEDHEHVYDLEQKQDGTGSSSSGELCTVEEVEQTVRQKDPACGCRYGKQKSVGDTFVRQKDPACGCRYGKQKSVGDTFCQNTRDLGKIAFCTPAAELGGEGSGYGGSEEGSCGGELQCHPVHADVTVVHKVADKDGVCIGEDKRTAADEKDPY